MEAVHLLRTVVTTPEGLFCLSTAGNGGDKWQDHWYEWPKQESEILSHAAEAALTYNVYFSSHLFGERRASKECVLPTRTIQADLDGADIYTIPVPPTAIIRTSQDRHQAFWVMRDTSGEGLQLPNDVLENFSRKMTYSIPECDRTGWPLGKRLRFPNTMNHKYGAPQPVEILTIGQRKIDPSVLEILPEVNPKFIEGNIESWVDLPHAASILEDVPPLETILSLQKLGKISAGARTQYSNNARDRSAALWRLMCELFQAGLNREAVYWLAFNSKNNKFLDRKYGGTRDLRKDVIRAEYATVTGTTDIREDIRKIMQATNLSKSEKLEKAAKLVQQYMQSKGAFINTSEGEAYYVKSDNGRPMPIEAHTKYIAAFMTIELGINSSTELFRYCIAHLKGFTDSMPSEVDVSSLSFFDLESRTLYLHTGKRDIQVITPDSRYIVPNGSGDILFKWSKLSEPFTFGTDPLPDGQTWYDFIYKDALDNVINMSHHQAVAMMAVWTIYTLLRSDLTRPILAIFGQPGSGKSTMMRMVYRLLYGRTRDLNFITTDSDFNHVTSENPLVVFDNADTWTKWLPDVLATSISNATYETRRLFTNKETVEFRRQAMVAMTAHSPKFIREDVADRLLVLTLARRPHYLDEKKIQARIVGARSALWGQIVLDVQRILKQPIPQDSEVPQFRMQDFATYGLWIARGLGLGDDFVTGLNVLRGSQSNLVVEGDEALIEALDRAIAARTKAKKEATFMSVSEWFSKLVEFSEDEYSFKKVYKNPATLGRKFWTVMEAFKTRFRMEWTLDKRTNARIWLIDTKADNTNTDEGE